MIETTPCRAAGCDRRMVSRRVWDKATRERRAELAAQGVHKHQGRGLCSRCYSRARAAGTLEDYPATVYTRAEVLDEWQAAGLDRTLSRAERCRRLAPRLGMSFAALERALDRAQVAA